MEFMFPDPEVQLNIERSRKYQGTAKIDLDRISFHPNFSRATDQRNIDRLKEIFRREGCRRLVVQNHITAVVSRESLRAALRAARKTPEELLATDPEKSSHLQFPAGQVFCLHGQHRIQAGAEFLAEDDRWWTVNLYLDDISSELRTSLVEEYTNEKQPSDGEIFRKISQYRQEGNAHFQQRWWTRLSRNKAKRLQGLHRNEEIDAAFTALLPIPGVWDGMSIGNLPKVMALKCDEEVVRYLKLVKTFWASLVSADAENPDRTAMMKIDTHTVEKLQLMAPGLCRQDARAVQGWVLSGEVLGAFSETERNHMWAKLRQFDGLIPSLHTFFQDVKYLEKCAHAVKRLFPLSDHYRTIRTSMDHHRPPTASEGCLIQTSESRFERRPGSRADYRELACRQVWLYAMRHYPQMAKESESDDPTAKPENENKADEVVVYEMAILAQKLGFKTMAIDEIINESPDRQIARDCLLKARKPDSYEFTADDFERSIRGIVEFFSKARLRVNPLPPDPHVHLPTDQKGRCGLPSTLAQRQDRRFLFVDHLHQSTVAPTEKLSTMAVRRSVYFAFFGRPVSRSPHSAADPLSPGPAPSDPPLSPLFFPDHESLDGPSSDLEMPLAHEREHPEGPHTEAEQLAAGQSQQQEAEQRAAAAAAERENARREAEERAAAAEQQRLQREAAERAVVAEQERLRQEAEEKAIAEAAEAQRAENEAQERAAAEVARLQEAEAQAAAIAAQERQQREAAEQAAQQERLRREEQEREDIAAEQERLHQEAMAREDSGHQSEVAPASEPEGPPLDEDERIARERDAALAQLEPDGPDDTVPLGGQPSETSQPDTALDLLGLIARLRERHGHAGSDSVVFESDELPVPAVPDDSPGATPVTQTAEVPAIEGLTPTEPAALDTIPEEAHTTPPAVDNWRAVEETEDKFTQTRPDLPSDDESVSSAPAANPHLAPGAFAAPPPPATAAADRGTHMYFAEAMPNLPAWPEDSGSAGRAAAESSTTAPVLSRLRRRRKGQDSGPAGSSLTQRHDTGRAPDATRPEPNWPSDQNADTIIFWVWRGGEWREIQRVVMDPSDCFEVTRVANRYERDHNAVFYDKAMHNIKAVQCLRAAQDDGTNSIFMIFPKGPADRSVTRAMTAGAEAVVNAGNPDGTRKRKREP